jgi:hypothetical protein
MLLLARYAMQNGASFVNMVRTKQAGNAEYDFLNVPGSSSYAFFQWALFATGCGLPIDQPLPDGFVPPAPQPQPQPQPQQLTPQQQQPPQYAAPMPLPSPQQQQMMYAQQPGYPGQPYMQPPPQHYQQQQQQPLRPTPPPIPPEVAGGFSQVLDALTGSKVRTRNYFASGMLCYAVFTAAVRQVHTAEACLVLVLMWR